MQKQVVITSVSDDNRQAVEIAAKIHTYGLDAVGAQWQDDLAKMAWQGQSELLAGSQAAVWMIITTPETMQIPSVRYGLSLAAIVAKAKRPFLPIFVVSPGPAPVAPDLLPATLSGAVCLVATDPTLPAKLVAKANLPHQPSKAEYRINVLGTPQIGLWFEAGPAAGGSWNGAIFGVSGGEIDFQAVGPAGELPKNSTLSYPSNGIKLEMSGMEFVAWGVANGISEADSYFARVRGNPAAILFGPFPDGDDAELYHLKF